MPPRTDGPDDVAGVPLRVVHVSGGLQTGSTRVVLDLLREHDRALVDPAVCFFAIRPAEEQVIAEVERLGRPYRDVVKRSRYDVTAPFRLARAFRALRAEVVVMHGLGTYSFGAVAARLAHVRASVRVEHSPELYNPILRYSARFAARLIDSTVLVAAHLGDYLGANGVPLPNPEVIHNGIDLAPFLAVAQPPFSGEGAPTLLCAARLDVAKDHATLLEAAALLTARGVSFRLRLAGSGPLEQPLRAQARALGIEKRVEFLGQRNDVANLLEHADVAVLSTHYEGCPLVLAEAMAAGRPLVATDVPGNAELLQADRHGYLAQHGSPIVFADALARMLADPTRARRMGEEGRAYALQHFGLGRAVRKMEAHILRTAARRGVRPPAPASATGAAGPRPSAS